jgi:AcrR family transcriptional regulator
MSSTTLSPRRHLSERQADTVTRLVDATVVELREHPASTLTVRRVAARAGVAPATAYTYFASKEHLVTEVFWQRLQQLAPPPLDGAGGPAERAGAALGAVALLVTDEPELAAACTVSMLASDPEVRVLRDAIGADIAARLGRALGDDADEERIAALGLAFSGAMVQAGMGHLDYDDVPAQLATVARLVLERTPRPPRPIRPTNARSTS